MTLGLLVLIPAAHAQQTSPEDRERALDLFQESAQHYEEGRFSVAAELLREAYDLHPEPVLLYNLGRALDGLGDAEAAIEAYHNYLEAAPEAEDRARVEERIAILSEHIEAERRQSEPTPAPAPGYVGAGPYPYAVAIAGGVALAAGGILWLEAEDRHDAAAQDPVHESAARRAEAAEDFAIAGNVVFVAGLLMAAGGAAWIAVDVLLVEPADAAVSIGPGGVSVRGRF